MAGIKVGDALANVTMTMFERQGCRFCLPGYRNTLHRNLLSEVLDLKFETA